MLSHCELITDEGIRHLGSGGCATETLKVLELDNCPLITDAALEHLMACQSLERIELYDCQLITRAGIRRLRVCYMSIYDTMTWSMLYKNLLNCMTVSLSHGQASGDSGYVKRR